MHTFLTLKYKNLTIITNKIIYSKSFSFNTIYAKPLFKKHLLRSVVFNNNSKVLVLKQTQQSFVIYLTDTVEKRRSSTTTMQVQQ